MQMRRKMGYVIQDGGLFPHLTARENTACWPGIWAGRRPKANARVEELAAADAAAARTCWTAIPRRFPAASGSASASCGR